MSLNRTQLLQIGGLTVLMGAIYAGIRALPEGKCAFLHYESRLNANGVPELCGVDEAPFIDLAGLKFAIEQEWVTRPERLKVGETAELVAGIRLRRGAPIDFFDLAVVHEERLHLMVHDPSLDDYHHLHPEPAGPGQYRFEFTPRRPGLYRFYFEMVPQRTLSKVVAELTLEVEPPAKGGSASVPEPMPPPSEVEVILVGVDRALTLNEDSELTLVIRGPKGEPVGLEKLMGAYAHLVAFSPERRGYAHMHPLDEGIGIGSGESRFGFAFRPDKPGFYRVWAQFRIEGRDRFVPFDLRVGDWLAAR